MTYHHLTGWNMPALNDGDVIRDSNLTGWVAPTDKAITVKHSILLDNKEDFPANIIFDDRCTFKEPYTEEPIDEFSTIKEQAKNKLLEVKPLAYENPLAVKVALSEAFTPEEFNGVMEAQ